MIPTIQFKAGLPSFSGLVYGAWRLADGVDKSSLTALKKIKLCIELGITTFDHADIYGDYRCEALFSAAHIRQSVDNSLRLLGVERLDALLIHRPDPFMNAAETGACLDALIQEGKIAAAGVSNFSVADVNLLQSAMQHPLVTNQLEISLLAHQSFADGSLSQCQQLKMRPMAWSPLGGGRLFGDGADAQRLRPVLARIGKAHDVDIDAVALAWLLAHPAGIVPVVGTNNLERIARLGDAFKVQLDLETWYELWTQAAGKEVP